MAECDFILCHNVSDQLYYSGLFGSHVYVNRSLMIEDTIKHIPFKEVPEEKVIIGGNLVKWYGGFDSLMVSQNFNLPVWVPQMGRMKREELQVETLNHLPYMQWNDWMEALSDFKFGVHLMPTAAAGTFAMNLSLIHI